MLYFFDKRYPLREMEEVIVNLNVLAQLKKGQKLNTRGEFLDIESPYFVPESVRRWYRHDTREHMLTTLNRIINHAIQLKVNHYLNSALIGIDNLKSTYSNCKQTIARLDMIVDKINAHLTPVEIVETF